jgi:hypothetical protein
MLLIDHPKKWIFALIAFLIVASCTFLFSMTVYMMIGIVSGLSPFLYFLDRKGLVARSHIILLIVGFYVLMALFTTVIIPLLPFYIYPILLAGFLAIAYFKNQEQKKKLTSRMVK